MSIAPDSLQNKYDQRNSAQFLANYPNGARLIPIDPSEITMISRFMESRETSCLSDRDVKFAVKDIIISSKNAPLNQRKDDKPVTSKTALFPRLFNILPPPGALPAPRPTQANDEIKEQTNKATRVFLKVATGKTARERELIDKANFMQAVTEGHVDVVKKHLRTINPNFSDSNGVIPLIRAADEGHLEVVEALLAAKANPNSQNGETALICAAQSDHPAIVEMLLATPGINVNLSDSKGRTALRWAAQKGHLEVLNALLAAPNIKLDSVDIHEEDNKLFEVRFYGNTPLTYAAYKGHPEAVKALLAAGANPNFSNLWRETALIYAAFNNHLDVVKVLLADKRTDPNAPDKWGCTPLFWAAHHGHKEIVKILLDDERVRSSIQSDNGEFTGENAFTIATKSKKLDLETCKLLSL